MCLPRNLELILDMNMSLSLTSANYSASLISFCGSDVGVSFSKGLTTSKGFIFTFISPNCDDLLFSFEASMSFFFKT